jgi:hypothetical protein
MAFRDLRHANLTAAFGCQIGWFAKWFSTKFI